MYSMCVLLAEERGFIKQKHFVLIPAIIDASHVLNDLVNTCDVLSSRTENETGRG